MGTERGAAARPRPGGRRQRRRRLLGKSPAPVVALVAAVLASAIAPVAKAQFDLTVVGAGIMDWSFLDPNLLQPGNDIALGNTGFAELIVRCQRGTPTPMQVQLTDVNIPDVWYDNLNYPLGTWNPDLGGQSLYCEAWECDNIIGCANGELLDSTPNPGLGDDYLGIVKIDPYDYRGDPVKVYTTVQDGQNKVALAIRCNYCYSWAQSQLLPNQKQPTVGNTVNAPPPQNGGIPSGGSPAPSPPSSPPPQPSLPPPSSPPVTQPPSPPTPTPVTQPPSPPTPPPVTQPPLPPPSPPVTQPPSPPPPAEPSQPAPPQTPQNGNSGGSGESPIPDPPSPSPPSPVTQPPSPPPPPSSPPPAPPAVTPPQPQQPVAPPPTEAPLPPASEVETFSDNSPGDGSGQDQQQWGDDDEDDDEANDNTPSASNTGNNGFKPIVSLRGDKTMYVRQGDPFNDPGVTASDAADGDVTSSVFVVGSVDTSTVGEYRLRYVASNSEGQRGFKIRIVEVLPSNAPLPPSASNPTTSPPVSAPGSQTGTPPGSVPSQRPSSGGASNNAGGTDSGANNNAGGSGSGSPPQTGSPPGSIPSQSPTSGGASGGAINNAGGSGSASPPQSGSPPGSIPASSPSSGGAINNAGGSGSGSEAGAYSVGGPGVPSPSGGGDAASATPHHSQAPSSSPSGAQARGVDQETLRSRERKRTKAIALAVALSIVAVILSLVLTAYCACLWRDRRRKGLERMGENLPIADIPEFRGPLRRIVVDSRSKGAGPGLTEPLQASTSGAAGAGSGSGGLFENPLRLSSMGREIDTRVVAEDPREVERAHREQRTGQPVRGILKGWAPFSS